MRLTKLSASRRFALLACLLAGAVSGCGGDDGSGRPARGEPIQVGFLNQEKGATPFPDFGAGARAARKYVNQKLGGVNGRPIEFVECLTDGSPESSIDCANKFAEAGVVTVLEGIDFSGDAVLPVLREARIPLVGHTAFGPAQAVSSDAFFFGAAAPAYAVAPLKVMTSELGAKSAVYLGADSPIIRSFVKNAVAPAAEALRLDLTPLYYQPTNPNFSAVFTSALAKKPDAIFTIAPEPDCVGIVKAAAMLSYGGKLFAGSCSAFIRATGRSANGVFTASDLWVPEAAKFAPNDKRHEITVYLEQMRASAPRYVNSYAQHTFSSTVDLATVLRAVEEPITPKSVTAALRATKRLSSFMGQPVTCDGRRWPGQPAACANGIIVYRVGNGEREPVTDGFLHAQDLVGSS